MLTSADKMVGSKKGQKHADVILEWFLIGSDEQLYYVYRNS